MLQKLMRTYRIFGFAFLAHYIAKFVSSRLRRSATIAQVMARNDVPIVRLGSAINSEPSLAAIGALKPDLLVSIGGNEIFRRPLLDLAPRGCINLHSALLPRYRGLMPSFWVLRFRERYTGVSVFLVDEGIDSGPIVVQKKIEIGGMTQEQLIAHSKKIGMQAVAEAIDKLASGHADVIANDASQATYFSFPTAEDVAEFRNAGARFF